jgi:dihydroorotase-like cyclic amidohydrolase
MSFDVLMRGATVVDAGVVRQLHVGVTDGLIAALGPELAGPATDRHSPFVGRTLSARVARTLVRGRTVFADGQIVGPPARRLLTPAIRMESP